MGNVNVEMLSEHIDLLSGFAFKSKEFNDKGLGTPVVRIRDVGKTKSNTFYNGSYSETYILQNGDLLIGMDGDFRIAKWSGGKALLNQRVCKIKANEQTLNNEYMYYILPTILKKIEDKTSFATVKHLSVKKINSIKIPLPPLPEQKRIATILDAADAYRQKTKALIAKYDELTQSLFLDMFGDPVGNPMGWEKIKTSYYYQVRGRVGWKGYRKTDLRQEGAIVLGATHITKDGNIDLSKVVYLSDEKYEESPEIMVIKNDLIFVQRGNTIGKVALVRNALDKATINPVVLIFRPTNNTNPYFLLYLLMNKRLNHEFVCSNSGSAQPMITQKTMKEFIVINIPINLQNKFAKRVQAIETQKAQAQTSLKKADDLFNCLLQKAFKGEL